MDRLISYFCPSVCAVLTDQLKRDRLSTGGVWKERRVVLTHNSELLWLVQPGEMSGGPSKDVKGGLLLDQETTVEALNQQGTDAKDGRFPFRVTGVIHKTRAKPIFAAGSEEERAQWLDAIKGS